MKPLNIVLLFLYFLSGFTALSYEVLWARQLGLVFGASNFGIVITVSAFLAGLGFGSLISSFFAFRFSKPLLIFAFLEALVGFYAFNMPSLLSFTDEFLSSGIALTSLSSWFTFQGVALFLLFFLPAAVMGFGFPVFLSLAKRINLSLANIYGLNTLGGVFGCLAPLGLLPAFGWTVSVRLTALISFLLAFLCVLLFLRLKSKSISSEGNNDKESNAVSSSGVFVYAIVGASALILQIGWSRMYGMVLLRTEYVVALLIASFLIGVAAGSLLSRLLKREFWFSLLPLLATIGVLVSLITWPMVAEWSERTEFVSLYSAMLSQGLVILLLTLPATLSFGAWLPLLAARQQELYASGAKLYAVNSIGSAVGAIFAGFVLFPSLGTAGTLVFAAVLLLFCGLYWHRGRISIFASVIILVALLPFLFMPSVSSLLPLSHGSSDDIFVYEDALSTTHVVANEKGHRFLLSDLQRMDASTESTAVTVQHNQGLFPVLLTNDPKKILFLGLGTGITATGTLPFGSELDVTAVELSRGAIIAAKKYFSSVNQNISEHIDVVHDDARRYLKSSADKYDVIVGDLFHPDLVGRSALLSRQQFTRAKEHLAPKGVFAQWIALNQFDVYSLQVVLKTFRDVFPDGVMFVDGFRIALIGGSGKISAQGILDKLHSSTLDKAKVFSGEDAWTWLGRYWGKIPVFDVPLQDEWAPVIEFSIPSAKYANKVNLAETVKYLLRSRPGYELAASDLSIPNDNLKAFQRAYEATNMIFVSWHAGMIGNQEMSSRFLKMAYEANPVDRWISFEIADGLMASLEKAAEAGIKKVDVLSKVLSIRPDHTEALKLLWRLKRAAGDFAGASVYAKRLLALNPNDPEVLKLEKP